MTPDRIILDLFRLGLKGDSASVRRYGKKLLQDTAVEPDVRSGVAKLLADSPPPQPVRWAGASSAPGTDTFFDTIDPSTDEELPLLPKDVEQEIEQLVHERDRERELEAIGLIPTRTLLLTGPPGVGKTLTARHIASRLGIPLLRVDLAGLMSSYLGKTGQNLRAMLLNAREAPSVLLLDEFDAIAKRRDDPADVGELKRIVNVLLLELEQWPSHGLLIAATNHPELLDRAIWRRFEKVLTIGPPSPDARRMLLRRHLERHGQRSVDAAVLETLVAATDGSSASDVVTLVRGAVRRAIFNPDRSVDDVLTEAGLEHLLGKVEHDAGARGLYCRIAHERFGATQREIASRIGISHVAVGKILRGAITTSAQGGPARKHKKETRR